MNRRVEAQHGGRKDRTVRGNKISDKIEETRQRRNSFFFFFCALCDLQVLVKFTLILLVGRNLGQKKKKLIFTGLYFCMNNLV